MEEKISNDVKQQKLSIEKKMRKLESSLRQCIIFRVSGRADDFFANSEKIFSLEKEINKLYADLKELDKRGE